MRGTSRCSPAVARSESAPTCPIRTLACIDRSQGVNLEGAPWTRENRPESDWGEAARFADAIPSFGNAIGSYLIEVTSYWIEFRSS